jgi:transcriptional regulator with XRE-family HTH domain
MTSSSHARVVSGLPLLLRRRGLSWNDLARRTLLPPGPVARLRRRHHNPQLSVAQRVAAALEVPVESIWRLAEPLRGRRCRR